MHQILGVHSIPFTEIWLLNISMKKWEELLAHFAQAISDIHIVKKNWKKKNIFIAGCEHFATSREIDKEVVDGLCHGQEVGNKYFKAFLLETLVEDEKLFFELFSKASLITVNEKKKKFSKPLSVVK